MVGRLALSVLKSGGGNLFGRTAVTALEEMSPMLLAILGKHAKAVGQQQGFLRALSSLEDIERSIACLGEHFPRREKQVCARMIFGMSSTSIALELAIGEETVVTYRKRLYQRLGIWTQRELLVWYISALLKASPNQARH